MKRESIRESIHQLREAKTNHAVEGDPVLGFIVTRTPDKTKPHGYMFRLYEASDSGSLTKRVSGAGTKVAKAAEMYMRNLKGDIDSLMVQAGTD